MADALVPVLNQQQLNDFGQRMLSKFGDYKKDRKALEEQWLRNMRQFRGVIDPEIEKRLQEDQSRAYPKVTRTKVINTVARLMEMLFPQTEDNWSCDPSPLPDLPEDELTLILNKLQAESNGEELTDEQIEKAVMERAKEKSARMTVQMKDQLDEMHYPRLARRVVFSGVLYGAGVLKGPLIRSVRARTWKRGVTGAYTAQTEDKITPYYDVTPVWNHYPDLSAKTLDQKDGDFERHIMNRQQVKELSKRPDFMADQIDGWLKNNTTGNFKEEWWETVLRETGDKQNISDLTGRKYELVEWWGAVDAKDLKAAGVKLPDNDMSEVFEANIWILGNTVIKAVINPYERKFRPNHLFIYEEDDISLMGTGLPAVMRDSQLGICEATRMMLDNASVTCGPMLEVNNDLLVPGQDIAIHAYKIFWREGEDSSASTPAVRAITVDSHIAELQAVIQMFMSFADTETALPPPAVGDVSQGGSEALRTTGNASMLLGAASLPIRDTVRNFDIFTESVIGSLYDWNMEFNEDDSIKGDYTIVPRGSTSLIAKEVRANSIDQFRASLSPDERVYVDTEKMLKERMRSRDVPMDILADKEVVAQRQQAQAEELASQKASSEQMIEAQIREIFTSAMKNISLANKADALASNDALKTILEGLTNAIAASQPKQAAGKSAK